MATKGLEAKTVGLKIKTTKFHVRTLDSTGQAYIRSAEDLFAAASALLHREIRAAAASSPGGKLRLRLMGVKASSFRGQARYPTLPGQGTLDGFVASTPTAEAAQDLAATGSAVTVTTEGASGCVGRGKGLEVGAGGAAEEIEDAEARLAAASSTGGLRMGCDAQEMSDFSRSGLTPVEAKRSIVAPGQPRGGVLTAAPRNRQGAGGGTVRQSVRQRLLGEPLADSPQGAEAAAAVTAVEAAEVVVVAAAAVVDAASLTCPVCLEELGAVSNLALNRHVDACVGVCTVDNEGGCGPVVAKRSGAGGYGPRRSKVVSARKRAKASGAGIAKFLTPREQT